MILNIEGVWCNAKTDFDKYIRSNNFDVVVSHPDIYTRLLKSDPSDKEPSDLIISLYIQKTFKNIPNKFADADNVQVAFLFKNLDRETINNFKEFTSSIFEDIKIDLIIINKVDYPKTGVLSEFDSVRFIEHD